MRVHNGFAADASSGRPVVATIGKRTGANSRVLTVPVQVGKGGPVRAGKQASETPQGELLIRMKSR